MSKIDIKTALITGLTVLCLILFFKEQKTITVYQKGNELVRIDTVRKDSLIFKKEIKIITKPKIEYADNFDTIKIHDTLMTVPIFTANSDTILGDTFKMKYEYPVNKFTLNIKRQADTMHTLTINKETQKVATEPFYNNIWFRVFTFFAGLFGGALVK